MFFFSDDIRPLLPLYVTMFLETVGSGLVASVLGVVARDDLGCSTMQVGIMWSSYNAALILGSLVMGHFSDFVRRKYVLMVTLLWVGGGYILTGFSDSFEWLLISRIVTGLCGGSFSVAASILTANLSSEVLPMAIGRLATCASLGFAVGPLLSSAITAIWNVDTTSPFYLQRLYFFVTAFVYVLAALTASRLQGSLTCPSRMKTVERSRDGQITRSLCLVWSSRYFSTCAVTGVYVTQVSMWREYLGFDRIYISLLTTASGLAVSIVQAFVFPVLVARIGFHQALLIGISFISLSCALIGPLTVIYGSMVFHIVCLCLFWFGVACMEPGTVVAVSRHLKQSSLFPSTRRDLHTGLAMGITSAMKYAASLSIPTVAGLLYDHHREVVYYVLSGVSFVGLIVVLAAWRLFTARVSETVEKQSSDDSTTECQTTPSV